MIEAGLTNGQDTEQIVVRAEILKKQVPIAIVSDWRDVIDPDQG